MKYGQLVRRRVNLEERLRDVIDKPAVTLDGVRVRLAANIEQASDTEAVLAYGADGVGLFGPSTCLSTEAQRRPKRSNTKPTVPSPLRSNRARL